MSKIRCVIVDDEPIARAVLISFVTKIPNLELVKSCKNAMEAFEVANQQKIDIFFLDINMPDISGLSLAKSINQKAKIIFTTAYREYAVDGFNLQAVDYLLKPISFDRFLQAIQKCFEGGSFIENKIKVGATCRSTGFLKTKANSDFHRLLHRSIRSRSGNECDQTRGGRPQRFR